MEFIEWHTPSQCTSFWTWLFHLNFFKRKKDEKGVSLRIFGFRFVITAL